MPAINDFVTWEPVLRALRAGIPEIVGARGLNVAGTIDQRGGCTLRGGWYDLEQMLDAIERVESALVNAHLDRISFVAEVSSSGEAVLHLLTFGPAVEAGSHPNPGTLILVEGAVPEPWRRLPDPTPRAVRARSADPELLERTLRERLPGATGAAESEIAAAEARLGVPLPDELRALYRATRARPEDCPDVATQAMVDAVGFKLMPLDALYIADAPSRPCPWEYAAMESVFTPPEAPVQGLVGSPGWIAFGANDFGDRIAVDLTPGPRGHLGQIIMIENDKNIGADLLAKSLTDQVVHRRQNYFPADRGDQPPVVVRVNSRTVGSIELAAHPEMEILSIAFWDREPLSLASLTGSPGLRTLDLPPGALADPLEIAKLTALEYLSLGPDEWRVLLDAGAVPRSLSAAAIAQPRNRDIHTLPIVAIANELLALWKRPPIIHTTIEGHLTPGA